jgi:hypothetical protein
LSEIPFAHNYRFWCYVNDGLSVFEWCYFTIPLACELRDVFGDLDGARLEMCLEDIIIYTCTPQSSEFGDYLKVIDIKAVDQNGGELGDETLIIA